MPKRRLVVVVNPRGGTRRGVSVLDEVRPVFDAGAAELDVHVTTHAGHALELARTIDLRDCDGICVTGGDGTIHEVVNGLMQRDPRAAVPLGIIPAGTGNSVCAHLQFSGPLDAARRIVAAHTQPLDVVRVTMGSATTHCVNIIGCGAVVDVNRTAERLRWIGPPRYTLSAMTYIVRARKRHARVTLDDQVLDDQFLLLVACNTRFTGKGMKLAPRAEVDDGKVDIVLVRSATRGQLLQLFNKVFDGSHLSLPFVEYYQVRSFSIEPRHVECLNLDGELKGTMPMRAEVLSVPLQVFV